MRINFMRIKGVALQLTRALEYRRMSLGRLSLILVLASVTGCASIDFDYPRTETRAFTDTSTSTLANTFSDALAAHDGKAGFLVLEDGVEALAIRLALAGQAERSIDTQYFLIHDDVVGRVFIEELLMAADRGVRVRLLLDDIHTDGLDPGLALLDSHPNFEVRLFNPFGNRSSKVLNLASVRRIVRRMHNKTFTVDNQVTVIGGRNIGDEYFGAPGDATFGDLDVLGIGPVVQDVSSVFDDYWNHKAALPMPALTRTPDDAEAALAELRTALAESRSSMRNSKYAGAVRNSILATLERDVGSLTFAPYKLVSDSPDKAMPGSAGPTTSIRTLLRESIFNAPMIFA